MVSNVRSTTRTSPVPANTAPICLPNELIWALARFVPVSSSAVSMPRMMRSAPMIESAPATSQFLSLVEVFDPLAHDGHLFSPVLTRLAFPRQQRFEPRQSLAPLQPVDGQRQRHAVVVLAHLAPLCRCAVQFDFSRSQSPEQIMGEPEADELSQEFDPVPFVLSPGLRCVGLPASAPSACARSGNARSNASPILFITLMKPPM